MRMHRMLLGAEALFALGLRSIAGAGESLAPRASPPGRNIWPAYKRKPMVLRDPSHTRTQELARRKANQLARGATA